MYIARILYPVKTLGPGQRIGIWFAGCPRRCAGCSNPELWERRAEYRTTPETVLQLISRVVAEHGADGFTLTGGEPFWQPEALGVLLPALAQISGDILIYTGYAFEEARANWPTLVAYASAIVDGPYVEALNTGTPLRGSENQRLILRDNFRERYETWLSRDGAENRVQNFTTRDGVISVGIHRPGYAEEMDRLLRRKGWKKI